MNSVEQLKKWAENRGWTLLGEYPARSFTKFMLGIRSHIQFISPDGKIMNYHVYKNGQITDDLPTFGGKRNGTN